jgi:maltose O-acetyltransferase
MLGKIAYKFYCAFERLKSLANKYKWNQFSNIDKTASVGSGTVFVGDSSSLQVGEHTYINQANISACEQGKVRIGKNCAIGYMVSIKAITHSVENPVRNNGIEAKHIAKDIIIGDRCWIGDGVYIREGVTLGDDVIIGANSVVTKSFTSNVIIAGVPAKIVRVRNLLNMQPPIDTSDFECRK